MLKVVRVFGNSMDSSDVQPSKIPIGRVFCVFGRLIDLSEVQYMNAFRPSDLTDGGRTMVSNWLMCLQIYAGTVCTLSPKTKEVMVELVL